MSDLCAYSDEHVQAAGVQLQDYCDHVEAALLAELRGELTTSPKHTVHRDGVYASACHAAWWTRKSVFFHNLFGADTAVGGRGGSTYRSTQLVVNGSTLEPTLMLAGSVVSTMVPVIVSCLGAKCLAREESSVIGLIGAGVQAKLHLTALKSLFPLERVLVYSRSAASCENLINHAHGLGLQASVTSAQVAVESADIVVSSISDSYGIDPFLSFRWIRDDAYVSSVDLLRPWAREEGVQRFLAADDLSQLESLIAEGRMPSCGNVDASLAAVLNGSVEAPPGRRVLVHPGCPSTLFGTTEAIRAALMVHEG